MASARNADGSLPVLPFVRLAATSDLIDKGTNVGLPFAGAAPDLGCFETGLVYDPSDSGTSSVAASSGGATGDGGGGGTGASDGGGQFDAARSGASSSSGSGSTSGSGSEGSTEAGAPDGETGSATGEKSGCGCESVGARHPPLRGAASVGLLLAGLGLSRRRRLRARSTGVPT
jgi:hypothetical protein